MDRSFLLAPARFEGLGVRLAADVGGDAAGLPILFLHGGGQTRHSWGRAAAELAASGYFVVSLDLRGHGDSDWAADGDYSLTTLSRDVQAVAAQLPARPVLVGASLGGIAALLAVGESDAPVARGLVLVDITPKIDPAGVKRITDFMNARPEGFATLDEAADAVANYMRGRPRPTAATGLLKNLRWRDGRYFWHWDPGVIRDSDVNRPDFVARLEAAARAVEIPTLLIRGARSEIVNADGVRHFLEHLPHAHFVDIADAGHMVAGDRNDAFNGAIFDFLRRHH
jgi:pimeloyl-ACP methyl ester carboxylesterase